MFEKSHQPLLPLPVFFVRLSKGIAWGVLLIAFALFLGMLGYHFFENMSWTDAFLNASMILSGMGQVHELKTQGGKIFAGFYALFSGLLFILVVGVVFGPVVHRFLHHFHVDEQRKAKSHS